MTVEQTVTKRNVIVYVGLDDILGATKSLSSNCPIARALRHSGFPNAFVYRGTWNPTEDKMLGPGSALLPDPARQFVRDFDADRPVSPRYLVLPLPEDE